MKNQPFSIVSFLVKLQKSQKSSDGGYVLVIAIGTVIALSGLLVVYGQSTRVQETAVNSSIDTDNGFFAAEAGLNQRAQQIREVLEGGGTLDGNSPQSPRACLGSDATKRGTGNYACNLFEFARASTTTQGYIASTYAVDTNTYVDENGIKGPTPGIVPQGELFGKLRMLEGTYSVYSFAFKQREEYTDPDKAKPSAILQMEIKTRQIPMFQFAAFYKGDLEILPGADMTLSGPVHTNGSLYLGANATLRIDSQVTVVDDLYSKRKNNNSAYDNGKVELKTADGTKFLKLVESGTGKTNKTTSAMDPKLLASAYGTNVQVDVDALDIPEPSFLDSSGQYFAQADIRINFNPPNTDKDDLDHLKTIPFEITAIQRTDSSDKLLVSPVETKITSDPNDPINKADAVVERRNIRQLRSLRQPVLVGAELANLPSTIPDPTDNTKTIPNPYRACSPENLSVGLQTWWNGLTALQKNTFRIQAQTYLQEQIQSMEAPLRFRYMEDEKIKSIKGKEGTLFSSFASDTSSLESALTAPILPLTVPPSIPFTVGTEVDDAKDNFLEMTPQEVAGLPEYDLVTNTVIANTARCYVAAPITDIGRDKNDHKSRFRFYNNRELRDIRMLQVNMQSLAIWNKDGQYLDEDVDPLRETLVSTNQLLYKTAPKDSDAPAGSFQNLGYAARDTSDGGMVIHAMVQEDDPKTTNPNTENAYTKESPYGFAVVKAQQLIGLARTKKVIDPTGLTIATDQAIYPQGDYNTVNYQPAGILSDSFNPLSNACIITEDIAINRDANANCNLLKGTNLTVDGDGIPPTPTTFNAGVLGGTDITVPNKQYNGGLENYPRFQENWGGRSWDYRGSFVSIGNALRVNGPWGRKDVYSPPERNWDYDKNFNDPSNLPPLTPQFVYIKQESFIRTFGDDL